MNFDPLGDDFVTSIRGQSRPNGDVDMAPIITATDVMSKPHLWSDHESRAPFWHDMTTDFLLRIHDEAQKRARTLGRRREARFQEFKVLAEKIGSNAATLLDQLTEVAQWNDETLRVIWNEATEIGIELHMLRSLESRNAI